MRLKEIISLLLCACLLVGAALIPAGASESARETIVGVLSDIHLFPGELIGAGYETLAQGKANRAVPDLHSEGVLLSALAALEEQAKNNGLDYLLITGDLTRDGEYLAHARLAEYLLAFEGRSGVQVAVIPGNHDVNSTGAVDYSSGASQKTKNCTPEEFRELYAQLGYDLADSRYIPPEGQQGGGLSYAADLGGFRLLALDTCKYSPDFAGREGAVASGMIGGDQMAWVLGELAAVKKAGRPVIGMGHHNLTEHLGYEGGLGSDFMLDDFRETREALADAGMHFYLSGHIHIEEVGRAVSDSGEVIYDISNSALVMFPYSFRVIKFSTEGGKIAADVSTLPIDDALPVTAAGVTYKQPYAETTGFAASFWGEENGLAGFAAEYLNRVLGRQLRRAGEKVGLGGLFAQTPWLKALLENVLGGLLRLRVSRLPCTAFIETLGFGDPNQPGTLEDFGNSALAYVFGHVGDYTQDVFFMDVAGRMQSGKTVLHAALARLAHEMVLSRPPDGDKNSLLVYDGPVQAEIGDNCDYRAPFDISVKRGRGGTSAEITWYTKRSVTASDVLFSPPAEGLTINAITEEALRTVNAIDLGMAAVGGEQLKATKHVVTIEGLNPGKRCSVQVGDAQRGWLSEPITLGGRP